MEKENRNWPSNNKDKRKGVKLTKINTPSSPLSINHCNMTTPLEHTFNNIVETSNLVATRSSYTLLKIQWSLGAIPKDNDYRLDTPPELIEDTNTNGQEQLKGVLMASLWQLQNNSPTNTESLHPGYSFQEHTDKNVNLPNQLYPWPYLSIEVNPTIGDPHIIGKEHMTSPHYDVGPLTAQPVNQVEDDFEQEVEHYPFGKNTFLDTNFLQVLGTLGDRELAAEGLWMIQLDSERRALKRWENQLTKRENQLHLKWVDLIKTHDQLNKRCDDIFSCLHQAKAASQLDPHLPDQNSQPGMTFPKPMTRPYYKTSVQEQRANGCYWCGENGLEGHRGKDCLQPHQRCTIYAVSWCVVPDHHSHYYSYFGTENCPYNRDHKNTLLSSEHA